MKERLSKISLKEILFQCLLLSLLLIIFIFDRMDEVFNWERIPFFINFSIAGLIIGYYLLPKYYYANKYKAFAIGVLLVVLAVIGMEEFVLEKIIYPDTRGSHFPGIAFSMMEVLPIMFMIVSFKFAWDLHHKNQEISRLESFATESELRFLKSQINPHFLFNNLNNLYSYSLTDPDKTSEIILEMSSVLRYMLYDCQASWVPLDKELHHVQHFINLNQLQIEDRGNVSLHIDNESNGMEIAPLILMVFIENAFKHSQSSMSTGIDININIKITEDGTLTFVCKNKYEATSNNDNLASGIGLANVKKRLNLLYPNSHDIVINDADGYYVVHLSMKLNALAHDKGHHS